MVVVCGRFGEGSTELQLLLLAAASCGSERYWREAGYSSPTAARSMLISRLRKRWGAAIHRETARVLASRLQYVGPRGDAQRRHAMRSPGDEGDAHREAAGLDPTSAAQEAAARGPAHDRQGCPQAFAGAD